jgi:hypothetical protein
MMDTEETETKAFTTSKGLSGAEAAVLLEQSGRNELEEKVKEKVRFPWSFVMRLLSPCPPNL